MSRSFYSKEAPTNNLITTIIGLLVTASTLIVSVLQLSGKIEPSLVAPLNEALGQIIAVGGQLVGYIVGLVLMFKAKD